MTNEEAIEELKWIRDRYHQEGEHGYDALTHAIEVMKVFTWKPMQIKELPRSIYPWTTVQSGKGVIFCNPEHPPMFCTPDGQCTIIDLLPPAPESEG
jgi:hypothetical protein